MDYIQELEGVILKLHGAKAKHANDPAKTHILGPTSSWSDYEAIKAATALQEKEDAAIHKAFTTRGSMSFGGLDALNKMGGFAGQSGDPAHNSILEREVELLERIAKATEKEGPRVL